MNEEISLDTRNMITVMLVQALLGAISPNFRRVALSFSASKLTVLCVLERDDDSDREEIEDIVDEFACLLTDLPDIGFFVESEIIIDSSFLPALDVEKWTPVFRRKEFINN